jgi:hypothetical protein
LIFHSVSKRAQLLLVNYFRSNNALRCCVALPAREALIRDPDIWSNVPENALKRTNERG